MPAHRPSVRRARIVLAGAAIGVLALTACSNTTTVAAKRPHTGNETASAGAGGVQEITLTTGNDLRFHPSTITVHPGRVQLVLDNTAPAGSGPPHNLQVDGLPAATIGLTEAGEKQQIEFMAPAPGRYHFVCTIHVAQGQTGTLIVTKQ